jgi:hypothetical protein
MHMLTARTQLPPQTPSLANVNLVQIISTYVHNGPYKTLAFSAPKGSSMNWVHHLPDLSNREPILDSALAALCLAHIGKTQKDENVLRVARLSYGYALKHFQTALARGRRNANIVSAMNCICVYEVSPSPYTYPIYPAVYLLRFEYELIFPALRFHTQQRYRLY